MNDEADRLRAELAEMRRQRDNVIDRLAELVRDFEARSAVLERTAEELDAARTEASQAHNRAQRLQAQVRTGARREEDRKNRALQEAVLHEIAHCDPVSEAGLLLAKLVAAWSGEP
jgi:ABC-type transporter Mla subunit MlaD